MSVERVYLGASKVAGPIIIIEGIRDVGYGEVVEVECKTIRRMARVLEVTERAAVCQVFEGTDGLDPEQCRSRFMGRPLRLRVGRDLLGRVLDGLGRPADGGPPPYTGVLRDINGSPINPVARAYPREFIETGVSAVDGLNTLVRGQKLPIFGASGLPMNNLASQIARQARLPGSDQDFVVVFVAMGIRRDDAEFFRREFEASGTLASVAMFLNLADDPPVERLATPRCGLTLAEHLAFTEGMHVLVIMTDITNYCEALREVSSVLGEVPSRKGYPGYMYSDLASLYERTGRLEGVRGSVTQLPMLTMPNDDITHPVPDLTGYITEGQIVLSRDLHQKGVYPPVSILPSLSRLMKDGIGEGLTRADHPNLASQLYAAYARVQKVRALASLVGEEELAPVDRRYLEFGDRFEREFLSQGLREARTVEDTLRIGWQALSVLPRRELQRLTQAELDRFHTEATGESTTD
jgi:V/A-type H+-transporting ATPase subunit B